MMPGKSVRSVEIWKTGRSSTLSQPLRLTIFRVNCAF
jgi:hypothetical protein